MMQHGYNGDYLQDPVVIVQHAGIVHNVVLQWPLQLKRVWRSGHFGGRREGYTMQNHWLCVS